MDSPTTHPECTESPLNIKSGPHSLTADLPPGHRIHIYSNRATLQAEAQAVLDMLDQNEHDGNQWILILDIPPSVINNLDNDKGFLDGINYRFQWEGTTGLVKIIPFPAFHQINADFTALVGEKLAGMGIHRSDRRWGLSTTYRLSAGTGTGSKGKQGDQIFLPAPRQPASGQVVDWPTLVLEIGVSASKLKLEEDAKWWFQNSNGRWQLLPPDAPAIVSRGYIASLQRSPLVVQTAVDQRCYCAQEVTVDRDGVSGVPMCLPFRALFDREPGPGEADIAITAQDFQEITATVL